MDGIKERVQKYTGKSEYEFGDLAKATFKRLSNATEPKPKAGLSREGSISSTEADKQTEAASKRSALEQQMLELLQFCSARLHVNGWKGKMSVTTSADIAFFSSKLKVSGVINRSHGSVSRAPDAVGGDADAAAAGSSSNVGDTAGDDPDAETGGEDGDDFEVVDPLECKTLPTDVLCNDRAPGSSASASRGSIVTDGRTWLRQRTRKQLLQAEQRVRSTAVHMRSSSISGAIGCGFRVTLPPWIVPGLFIELDVAIELELSSVIAVLEIGSVGGKTPAAAKVDAGGAVSAGSAAKSGMLATGNTSGPKPAAPDAKRDVADEATERFANAMLATQLRLRGLGWSGSVRLQADFGVVRLWISCPLRFMDATITATLPAGMPTVDDDQPASEDAADGTEGALSSAKSSPQASPGTTRKSDANGAAGKTQSQLSPKSAPQQQQQQQPAGAAGKGQRKEGPGGSLFRAALDRNIARIDRMAIAFAANGMSGSASAEFSFKVFGFGMTVEFEVDLTTTNVSISAK